MGLSSHRDAFGIEGMVGEKMVANTWRYGWQALGAEPDPRATWGHLTLGLPCLCAGSAQTLARPKVHGSSVRTQFSWVPVKIQGSWVLHQDQFSWVLCPDPVLLDHATGPVLCGPASGSKADGFCIKTLGYWILGF